MNRQKAKREPSLDEVYRLAKDNNRMLRAIRRDAFVGGIVKFVFWIAVFFVLPYILYVIYLQPYLENIQTAYEGFNESASTLNEASDELKNFKNQFPNFGDFFGQFGGSGN